MSNIISYLKDLKQNHTHLCLLEVSKLQHSGWEDNTVWEPDIEVFGFDFNDPIDRDSFGQKAIDWNKNGKLFTLLEIKKIANFKIKTSIEFTN